MAAKPSTGIPVETQCYLKNNTDVYVTLDSQSYWHGYGQPPRSIQSQTEGYLKHSADDAGSIGGISYVLGNQIKWIVAWSNAEDQSNKVYTNILKASDVIDWADIKANLGKSGNQSSVNNINGYTSEVVIDASSPTPKLTAKLRQAI
ncbi:23 kDa jasmonate-induced protein-like protein [Corchorus olitorius]|uniref:23 kDa jasmonate-induced protein-like protein n=1 Tax=Corchorus olitorius TaxID=93759 RepID=A0A1R3K8F3_9ROSI|nr:23 kDa jasmonate-induced protein-like protein [Corchorus olitorius]